MDPRQPEDPAEGDNDTDLDPNRQRVYFSYLANPATNLTVRSLVQYQTDTNVVREFFEGDYRLDPQPRTFVEVNRFWQNFNVNTYVQPQVNSFLETIERLPEVRVTGLRQQLWETPLYYQSESSAGYYRRRYGETNGIQTGPDYAATRVDTYHQLLLPHTFFDWLNVTPSCRWTLHLLRRRLRQENHDVRIYRFTRWGAGVWTSQISRGLCRITDQ